MAGAWGRRGSPWTPAPWLSFVLSALLAVNAGGPNERIGSAEPGVGVCATELGSASVPSLAAQGGPYRKTVNSNIKKRGPEALSKEPDNPPSGAMVNN